MAPTRILFWSPKGSSTSFYGGPAIGSYRLYRQRDHAETVVTLAHASRAQPAHPEVFDEQHQIFPVFHFVKTATTANAQSTAGGERQPRDFHPRDNSLFHLFRKLAFIQRSRRWLDHNAARFDVFHGMGVHADTVEAAVHAQSLGLPAVVTTVIEGELAMASRLATMTGAQRRRMAQLPHMAAVVSISQSIRARLLELGVPADRIVDLPLNGVDIEGFSPLPDGADAAALRRDLGLKDRPTCLFVGTIVVRKRPHLLLPALAALKARGLDGQLVLVGPEHEPEYAARMRREAEQLGVADRVQWFGFTTRVGDLMRVADTLALPSTDEGLPGVIMEAMACGVPCIYTDISGARDLIDDGRDGRIIAPDGSGLDDALVTYLGQPEAARAHGLAARRKAEKTFSNRAVFTKYVELFRNVRAGKPPLG